MLPSASLGSARTPHGIFGLYEPIHGSAPDIAGTDKANPIGAILSGAMLLRWSLGELEAAAAIEAAVSETLDDGLRTADIADIASAGALSVAGTTAMGDAVAERVAKAAELGAGGRQRVAEGAERMADTAGVPS